MFVWKAEILIETKIVYMILDLQQLANLQPFRNTFRGESVSLVFFVRSITQKLKVRGVLTILLRDSN